MPGGWSSRPSSRNTQQHHVLLGTPVPYHYVSYVSFCYLEQEPVLPDVIETIAPVVPLPTDAPPGLYVHVPFCRHICPYCDFNTYAGQEKLIPAYVAAVIEEMRIAADGQASSSAPTLFFGGGTPSLLTPEQVASVVSAARELFGLVDDAEVTL
ncbi:MAG: hypothetical protein M3439_07230, partial [Chloroflexota bacterium]|nr:hypothetical protein [Chloroflexota bacterium]